MTVGQAGDSAVFIDDVIGRTGNADGTPDAGGQFVCGMQGMIG